MSKTETECRNKQSENAIAEHLRAREAARYLSCGVSTLWLWKKQSKIKAYKLSERVTIFKKSELDDFINGVQYEK